MTEIPEHLLKRAAERRAALSGGGDEPAEPAGDSGDAPAPSAAEAPAAVEKAPAAPAPLPTLADEAPVAKPDSPVVATAKRRKRVPYWAAPALVLLPLWAVVYVYSIQPPPAGENDPMVIGAEVFNQNCASCHKADGSGVTTGGSGAQLSDGEVLKTFPDPLDMAYWIHYGADHAARPDGTYGDPDREGGAKSVNDISNAAMPGFDKLTSEERAAVIIYVREKLAEGDPADDPSFNSKIFEEDPSAMADLVEKVTALDQDDPDAVADAEGREEGA